MTVETNIHPSGIPMPPEQMLPNYAKGTSYYQIGDRFLQHFIEFGGLQPNHDVLDVGSGVGRMAVPLTQYLDSEKSQYEGFDIVSEWVTWCQQEITSRYPHFQFQLADLYNKRYNPAGKQKADSFTFPYGNKTFDFVYLTSVFTHMLPPGVERYLSEIHRVLKPGGRVLITFFLLNEESRQRIQEGKTTSRLLRFRYNRGDYRVGSWWTPEKAVAYQEDIIRAQFAQLGFVIQAVHYGGWCLRPDAPSGQDIIVAEKA